MTPAAWVAGPDRKTSPAASDGREDLDASDDVRRVLRGVALGFDRQFRRCAFRYGFDPYDHYGNFGFRVVALP